MRAVNSGALAVRVCAVKQGGDSVITSERASRKTQDSVKEFLATAETTSIFGVAPSFTHTPVCLSVCLSLPLSLSSSLAHTHNNSNNNNKS